VIIMNKLLKPLPKGGRNRDALRGSVVVDVEMAGCTKVGWPFYHFVDGRDRSGHGALWPDDAGLPLVEGGRYRVTFEVLAPAKNARPTANPWTVPNGRKAKTRLRGHDLTPEARKYLRWEAERGEAELRRVAWSRRWLKRMRGLARKGIIPKE
jgi:hypothetical protein